MFNVTVEHAIVLYQCEVQLSQDLVENILD